MDAQRYTSEGKQGRKRSKPQLMKTKFRMNEYERRSEPKNVKSMKVKNK